jgi:hypothetical protein
MFNFKRFVVALIGLLTLCDIDARADSLVITNISGFLTVDAVSGSGSPILRPPTFFLSGSGLSLSTLGIGLPGDVGNVEARDICLRTGCGAGTVLGTVRLTHSTKLFNVKLRIFVAKHERSRSCQRLSLDSASLR